jgi:hypothetical protein
MPLRQMRWFSSVTLKGNTRYLPPGARFLLGDALLLLHGPLADRILHLRLLPRGELQTLDHPGIDQVHRLDEVLLSHVQ